MFIFQRLLKRLIFISMVVFAIVSFYSMSVMADGESVSTDLNPAELTVYKSPSCKCCSKWIRHVKKNGFEVNALNDRNLSALKISRGIQKPYQSCHTAISKDGYVFEGHVPAKFIKKFLREKPKGSIGLSVPAMPVGTPGMEYRNKFTAYKVLLLKSDGSSETYASVNSQEEQY